MMFSSWGRSQGRGNYLIHYCVPLSQGAVTVSTIPIRLLYVRPHRWLAVLSLIRASSIIPTALQPKQRPLFIEKPHNNIRCTLHSADAAEQVFNARYGNKITSSVRDMENRFGRYMAIHDPMVCYFHMAIKLIGGLNISTLVGERSVTEQNDRQYYNDVMMSAMASRITNLTIVYSTVYSGADQRNH